MRKAVAAVLHHSTNDPDSKKRQSFCLCRPDLWCKYQKENIDPAVSKLIAPVFSNKDLGQPWWPTFLKTVSHLPKNS